MVLARLALCAYVLALALAAVALPGDGADLPVDATVACLDLAPSDAPDELLADDDSFDADDNDFGVDGDDDAVPVARVTLPAPGRLAQPVAAALGAPRPSSAVDNLFRPPRTVSSV